MSTAASESTSSKVNTILHNDVSFIWRPRWFLITRFLAVGGVAAALVSSRFVFRIGALDYSALWLLMGLLFLSNLLYSAYYRFSCLSIGCPDSNYNVRLTIFTITQISIDLIILTLMLHYSGGATNPFILYFFFHTLLASILLSKKAAYIESVAAAALFSAMTILEGSGIVTHYTLFGTTPYTDPLFISGMCFAMTSALIIAVYMANAIMDHLRQHQRELEHALNETARLESEKSRFLDVVAHDLKGPLASIETMAASNLAVFGDELPSQVKQTLERIPVRTGQLLLLIQELLDFSRITQLTDVQLEFKQLHFLPIVTATVEMYMNDALDKNITVTLNADPDLPPMMGNKNHLERMVGNLISNAIRYTPSRGSVKVKVTSQNGMLVLTVADTGIGIPEESIPSIFTNFYRAKNARKMDTSGTGLGLSITKAIVEKHRGTISFTSTEGEGTVFTVSLPSVQR